MLLILHPAFLRFQFDKEHSFPVSQNEVGKARVALHGGHPAPALALGGAEMDDFPVKILSELDDTALQFHLAYGCVEELAGVEAGGSLCHGGLESLILSAFNSLLKRTEQVLLVARGKEGNGAPSQ